MSSAHASILTILTSSLVLLRKFIMESTLVRLLPELKLCIAQCLRSDRDALCALSLTSSEWLPLAQRWLFSTFRASLNDTRSIQSYRKFLCASPHLALHVTRFVLVETRRQPGCIPLKDVLALVALLPRVRSVTVHSCRIIGRALPTANAFSSSLSSCKTFGVDVTLVNTSLEMTGFQDLVKLLAASELRVDGLSLGGSSRRSIPQYDDDDTQSDDVAELDDPVALDDLFEFVHVLESQNHHTSDDDEENIGGPDEDLKSDDSNVQTLVVDLDVNDYPVFGPLGTSSLLPTALATARSIHIGQTDLAVQYDILTACHDRLESFGILYNLSRKHERDTVKTFLLEKGGNLEHLHFDCTHKVAKYRLRDSDDHGFGLLPRSWINIPLASSCPALRTLAFTLKVACLGDGAGEDILRRTLYTWRYALQMIATAPSTLTSITIRLNIPYAFWPASDDTRFAKSLLRMVDWAQWIEVLAGFSQLRSLLFEGRLPVGEEPEQVCIPRWIAESITEQLTPLVNLNPALLQFH
ncbi:hypothetical protein EIP91_008427 [Steccherinum ochraceum]|uniref:F-box domain-containing protein n=1 Tax=Steccherinum ochraceum TaxID=92696 RepID=A0A4R0RCX1_9APHY|nr:hypothetical protein EIP91_008427 [Steccherinum ochraceum]